MRSLLLILALLLLNGCGQGPRQPRVVYPRIDESPPPPLAPRAEAEELDEMREDDPAEIASLSSDEIDVTWAERERRAGDLIGQLRRQASSANEDSPFALSEEAISELEKEENLEIY